MAVDKYHAVQNTLKPKRTICSNKTNSGIVPDKGAEMSSQELWQAFHCNTRQQNSAKNFLHCW